MLRGLPSPIAPPPVDEDDARALDVPMDRERWTCGQLLSLWTTRRGAGAGAASGLRRCRGARGALLRGVRRRGKCRGRGGRRGPIRRRPGALIARARRVGANLLARLVARLLAVLRRRLAAAAVRPVEAAALEHDSDGGEHLAEPACALRAVRQRRVREGLHGVELV